MELTLFQNIEKIVTKLKEKGLGVSEISHAMGYTTTKQLHNVLSGESLISTKAITNLITNFNVNPIFLFMGVGDMFDIPEKQIKKLTSENEALRTQEKSLHEEIAILRESIKTHERRNADLIDITAAAIKFYQSENKK